PGALDRAAASFLRVMQRHVYSTELYKRIYLTLRFRLTESTENQRRLEHLETEDALLGRPNADQPNAQTLGAFERLSEEDVRSFECQMGPKGPPDLANAVRSRAPELRKWFAAVEGFHALHRADKYR